ncbi:hypothetical protein ACP6ED_27770 (plasmid) [Klebsiella pneumoniae subsp. pneumoniae]|uniref:Uncharacterized protein n=1 Tax=Klebsiella pneumoniae subsp. pneumoniae TaxID=72407 RepID=A0ACC7QM84_KLEPN
MFNTDSLAWQWPPPPCLGACPRLVQQGLHTTPVNPSSEGERLHV